MRTLLLCSLASLAAAVGNVACGDPKPPADPYAVHVAPAEASAPAQTGAPEVASRRSPAADPPLATMARGAPPGDVCAKIPATRGNVPYRNPNAKRPTAGQMTEQAAQAKRLFDSERWPEAELAMKRVAGGDTGDDDGNRQLADYHRAIVLFRLKRYEEAAARFRAFSRDPGHLKFLESLLWIVKLAREEPKVVRLEDVALYQPEELARFDNPNQRETHGAAAYLIGHERYDEGNLSEAKTYLEIAKRVGPWSTEAERCLGRIAQTTPGSPR